MAKKGVLSPAQACDRIRIEIKDGTILEGMVMPNSTDETVVLKLSSGYNVGILRSRISKLTTLSAYEKSAGACAAEIEGNALSHPIAKKEGMKTIAILHTGGTVASKVNYENGGVSSRFTPEELLAMYPEIGAVANIRSRLIRNMFSEDMRFHHYNLIGHAILEEIAKGVDGIIVTHGTDTLAYTSAALSFMLEGLRTPVILVGSQRSADRGSSDAALNLLCACHFIVNSDFAGVAICMHHGIDDSSCAILPACKSRKMHSSRRDAFQAINAGALAVVGRDGKVTMLTKDYVHRDPSMKPTLKAFKEELNIGFLKAHPNMKKEEVLMYKDFDGLIVEGTGLGHLPVNKIDDATQEHDEILKALSSVTKRLPVVMTTQTIFGRVNMNVYSTGRKIQEVGVIGNLLDMHPETAFIKLAWLLSNYSRKEISALFHQNLRGEISERSEIQPKFL